MRVAMLGTLEVHAGDGRVAEIGGRQLRVLLARLALDVGRAVPVETLLTDLWAGDPPSGGANAVQTLVARLRRSLRRYGAAEALRSAAAGYRLDLDPADVDVLGVEQLAVRGRAEARAGETAAAARSLTEALRRWRGRPLADLPPLPFVEEARHRLVESHLTLTEDWAEARFALGDLAEVVDRLEPLAREWPLRERLAGVLIEALAAVGRLADALAAYDRLRRTLAEELGVDPAPALRSLHLRLLRANRPGGGTAGAHPPPTAEEPSSPRPPEARRWRGGPRAPVTSFVGREAELGVALGLLDRSRLVTLVGPGGAGKTRMATELVGALGAPGSSSGPDGRGDPGEVVFVELAPVGNPAELMDALVYALDVRRTALLPAQAGWRQPIVELVDVLASRPSLLVLDNCEHLVDAVAPLVADLLARCPQLRVLATSREALVVPGEALCQIGSLGLPPDRAGDAEIRQAPAVRLFADRAAAVSHGFRLTDENVEVVADVCRRLDGLPLPIELAAARLRSMTLRQLVDRLDDRFRLLAAGARSALPRHRTLRAVVEWSWDLLLPPERVLARRLAVFANSATVESVTEICASEDLPAEDIFYLLTSLVDKSLVDIVDDHAGRSRYRMLETVRAYAAERLREAGEDRRLRAAHAEHHLRLAQWADGLLRGQDQLTAIATIHAEHDNLHAALRWAVETREAGLALEFGTALSWYWWLFAHETEAAARVAEILRVVEETGNEQTPAARAALHAIHAVLRTTFTDTAGFDWAGLHRACRETEAMLRYPVLAMIELTLALYAGRPEAARASMASASASPDPWARAISQLNRLLLLEIEGRFEDIRGAIDEVVRALTAVGDRWGTSRALFTQLVQQSLEGDHEAVLRTGEDILALVTELGAEPDIVHVRQCMAQEKVRAGQLDEGEREIREQLHASLRAGRPSLEPGARCLLAQVHRYRGHHVQAREELAMARERLRGQRHELSQQFHGLVLLEEAMLELREGRLTAARAAADEVLTRFSRPYELPIVSLAAEVHADVALQAGDPEGAARLLGVSHALRGTLDEGNPDLRRVRDGVRAALSDDEWRHHFWSTASLSQAEAEEVLRRARRPGPLPDAPSPGPGEARPLLSPG